MTLKINASGSEAIFLDLNKNLKINVNAQEKLDEQTEIKKLTKQFGIEEKDIPNIIDGQVIDIEAYANTDQGKVPVDFDLVISDKQIEKAALFYLHAIGIPVEEENGIGKNVADALKEISKSGNITFADLQKPENTRLLKCAQIVDVLNSNQPSLSKNANQALTKWVKNHITNCPVPITTDVLMQSALGDNVISVLAYVQVALAHESGKLTKTEVKKITNLADQYHSAEQKIFSTSTSQIPTTVTDTPTKLTDMVGDSFQLAHFAQVLGKVKEHAPQWSSNIEAFLKEVTAIDPNITKLSDLKNISADKQSEIVTLINQHFDIPFLNAYFHSGNKAGAFIAELNNKNNNNITPPSIQPQTPTPVTPPLNTPITLPALDDTGKLSLVKAALKLAGIAEDNLTNLTLSSDAQSLGLNTEETKIPNKIISIIKDGVDSKLADQLTSHGLPTNPALMSAEYVKLLAEKLEKATGKVPTLSNQDISELRRKFVEDALNEQPTLDIKNPLAQVIHDLRTALKDLKPNSERVLTYLSALLSGQYNSFPVNDQMRNLFEKLEYKSKLTVGDHAGLAKVDQEIEKLRKDIFKQVSSNLAWLKDIDSQKPVTQFANEKTITTFLDHNKPNLLASIVDTIKAIVPNSSVTPETLSEHLKKFTEAELKLIQIIINEGGPSALTAHDELQQLTSSFKSHSTFPDVKSIIGDLTTDTQESRFNEVKGKIFSSPTNASLSLKLLQNLEIFPDQLSQYPDKVLDPNTFQSILDNIAASQQSPNDQALKSLIESIAANPALYHAFTDEWPKVQTSIAQEILTVGGDKLSPDVKTKLDSISKGTYKEKDISTVILDTLKILPSEQQTQVLKTIVAQINENMETAEQVSAPGKTAATKTNEVAQAKSTDIPSSPVLMGYLQTIAAFKRHPKFNDYLALMNGKLSPAQMEQIPSQQRAEIENLLQIIFEPFVSNGLNLSPASFSDLKKQVADTLGKDFLQILESSKSNPPITQPQALSNLIKNSIKEVLLRYPNLDLAYLSAEAKNNLLREVYRQFSTKFEPDSEIGKIVKSNQSQVIQELVQMFNGRVDSLMSENDAVANAQSVAKEASLPQVELPDLSKSKHAPDKNGNFKSELQRDLYDQQCALYALASNPNLDGNTKTMMLSAYKDLDKVGENSVMKLMEKSTASQSDHYSQLLMNVLSQPMDPMLKRILILLLLKAKEDALSDEALTLEPIISEFEKLKRTLNKHVEAIDNYSKETKAHTTDVQKAKEKLTTLQSALVNFDSTDKLAEAPKQEGQPAVASEPKVKVEGFGALSRQEIQAKITEIQPKALEDTTKGIQAYAALTGDKEILGNTPALNADHLKQGALGKIYANRPLGKVIANSPAAKLMNHLAPEEFKQSHTILSKIHDLSTLDPSSPNYKNAVDQLKTLPNELTAISKKLGDKFGIPYDENGVPSKEGMHAAFQKHQGLASTYMNMVTQLIQSWMQLLATIARNIR